jgi:hypothetical protein
MKRNHIHLAQGVAGDNVVSGELSYVFDIIQSLNITRYADILKDPYLYRRSQSHVSWHRILPLS